MSAIVDLVEIDPFDLPEWLGESEVVWAATSGLRQSHLIHGVLSSPGEEQLPCDLMTVDPAYPMPVVVETERRAAHQAWQLGQVRVVAREDRLTLTVPGTGFDADLVLDALARLSKAVGADAERYSVLLRIGEHSIRGGR